MKETNPNNFTDMNGSYKIHYLKYINHVEKREWKESEDSLHRYFDYWQKDEDRILASYAIYKKAELHFEFEHYDQCLVSINEAIKIGMFIYIIQSSKKKRT
jgi:hypothetical protein